MPAPAHSVPVLAASFFALLSPEGYPPTKVKNQPWKKLWGEPKQAAPENGKMVVACSSSHDHGNVLKHFFSAHTERFLGSNGG
jgi:hypothetical protein